MQRKIVFLFSLLLITSMLLTACKPAPAPETNTGTGYPAPVEPIDNTEPAGYPGLTLYFESQLTQPSLPLRW